MTPPIKTASVFSALLLSASLAAADPVTYDFTSSLKNTGGFTQVYNFSLGSGAYFNGSLLTTSSAAGNLPVTSVMLSNGNSQYRFDTLNDGYDFASITSGTTTKKVGLLTLTYYQNTYNWDPVFLAAGDWTVSIVGTNVDGKYGGTLNLTLVDPPAGNVPEPATLALTGVALAGVAFVRRRRKS